MSSPGNLPASFGSEALNLVHHRQDVLKKDEVTLPVKKWNYLLKNSVPSIPPQRWPCDQVHLQPQKRGKIFLKVHELVDVRCFREFDHEIDIAGVSCLASNIRAEDDQKLDLVMVG